MEDTLEEIKALTEKYQKRLAEKKNIIANMLEMVIDLEFCLNELFETYFMCKGTKATEFSEYLLEQEFFTFEQKIRLLQRIKLEQSEVCKFDKNTYLKLRKIQVIRNKLSHSRKSYDEVKECWEVNNIFFNEKFKKDIMKDYLYVLTTIVFATSDLKKSYQT